MNSGGKNEIAAIIMQKRPLPNLNTGYWISLSYYTSWDSRKPRYSGITRLICTECNWLSDV
jgi:hypothetical protein